MAREYRVDRTELRPPKKRADGSVRYDAVLSRVGVFEYRQPDGTIRREYRSAEEVGRADSLASLELTPVTDGHPAQAGTAKKVVGAVGDRVDFDGQHIKASIVIYDDAVNARIARADVRELSPGYSVEYVATPGVAPWGEAYDGLQTEILYDHNALVPRGRQGSTVALRADEAEPAWRADAAIQLTGWGSVNATVRSTTLSQDALEQAVKIAIEATPGMTLRTDAADRADKTDVEVTAGWADSKGAACVSVSTRELSLDDLVTKLRASLATALGDGVASIDPSAASAATPPRTDRADTAGQEIRIMDELKKELAAALIKVAEQTARADAAEAKVKAESARADKLEGERDAAKDRADAADKLRTDAIAAAPGQVRARLQLEAQAAGILGAEFKFDGLDDTAIKAAVVAKLTTKALPADKVDNADYVAARFDAAIEQAGESAAAGAQLREAVGPADKVRVDDLDRIRADAHEAARTAGSKPLTATGSN